MATSFQYKRILLKLSGEGLSGEKAYGLDENKMTSVANEIKKAYESGVQLALVIGGGNIFRGLSGAAKGMDRVTGDYMGMLATVINALAMQDALTRVGVPSKVFSGISMPTVCEPYICCKARAAMEKGFVVLCAGGTGNPFFTTDTGATLRAAELNCQAVFKATQVDGVYSADPKKDKNAVRFEKVSYDEVLQKNLKVMDAAAIAMARDNGLDVVVFSMHEQGALHDVLLNKGAFTRITNEEE